MKEKDKSQPKKPEGHKRKRPVILLTDLVPREEISGGKGKRVFGVTGGTKRSDREKE